MARDQAGVTAEQSVGQAVRAAMAMVEAVEAEPYYDEAADQNARTKATIRYRFRFDGESHSGRGKMNIDNCLS